MSLSGVTVATHVRVYCAGPSHNHFHTVLKAYATQAEVEHAVRVAGFRMSPDGRWWCEKHRSLMPKEEKV